MHFEGLFIKNFFLVTPYIKICKSKKLGLAHKAPPSKSAEKGTQL